MPTHALARVGRVSEFDVDGEVVGRGGRRPGAPAAGAGAPCPTGAALAGAAHRGPHRRDRRRRRALWPAPRPSPRCGPSSAVGSQRARRAASRRRQRAPRERRRQPLLPGRRSPARPLSGGPAPRPRSSSRCARPRPTGCRCGGDDRVMRDPGGRRHPPAHVEGQPVLVRAWQPVAAGSRSRRAGRPSPARRRAGAAAPRRRPRGRGSSSSRSSGCGSRSASTTTSASSTVASAATRCSGR